MQQVARTNNRQVIGSLGKISFKRRKIKVKVLQREKSICNWFYEQKSAENKFHGQKSVPENFQEQKHFHEEKSSSSSSSRTNLLEKNIS